MTVEVAVFGRNMDVTDRLHDYVTKKVSKLDRFLNGIEEARVDLSYVKSARSASDRQVAQITVRGKGFILRSEERADDIFAALDVAISRMQRQIERYKGKRNRGRGDGTSLAEVSMELENFDVEEFDEDMPVIARRKKFVLVPMNESEALEQMNLLGHQNFFIYYNPDQNAVNVLYRRRDGTYGLIETVIG
jgi:putative sigma-54 modulation protein